MKRPDGITLEKLDMVEQEGNQQIRTSYYTPIYYPEGTTNPSPIAWVRNDMMYTLSRILEAAAKENKL